MKQEIKIKGYDTFQCIADQCPLTCCQEWKIGVDEKTFQGWEGLKLKTQTIKDKQLTLCDCVEHIEGSYHIQLNKDKKCPFLSQNKLCHIVMDIGEDYLSETCTTFPRQVTSFEDRIERGLDPGCPVVIDLLNQVSDVIEVGVKEINTNEISEQSRDLLYSVREMIFTLLKDKTYLFTERLMMIFYILLELLEEEELTDTKIKACISEKQLKPLVRAIRKMKFNTLDSFFERNELFLDVVENYRKQKLYVQYLEEIATLAEKLEQVYSEEELLEKVQVFKEQFASYEELLKNYLMVEVFSNCLLPEGTLEDTVASFEWIVLEYSVLQQAIFLKWLQQGEKTITYDMMKSYMNVISRVTGYDQSDIKEYLQNSFESMIWEWGYLALVVGNSKI